MKIIFESGVSDSVYSANVSDGLCIYEVMEAISGLLLTTGFNYLSIIKAHEVEVERMNEAIRKGDEDD